VDGEGCFIVSRATTADVTMDCQLQPELSVTQHEDDVQVLYALKDYFKCGQVYPLTPGKKPIKYWRVKKLKDLVTKVIPFFEKHKLKTKRGIEFKRFRRICL
jgi:hypothetical protein